MFEEDIDKIHEKIATLLETKDSVLIAIDGNCGAGKSTLGSELMDYFNGNLFHMDDFYLTPDLRTRDRALEPGGNVDYVRFKKEVLDQLIKELPFDYDLYECSNQEFHNSGRIIPKKVNIIEGSYSLHPTLIDSYDFKIYLEIPKQVQENRIMKRNGPIVFEQFKSTWIPLENFYFQTLKIKEKSDIVIDTSN